MQNGKLVHKQIFKERLSIVCATESYPEIAITIQEVPRLGISLECRNFVWVEALRLIQQFFSHVATEPPLPGYYQYFLGGKCILLKVTTQQPE